MNLEYIWEHTDQDDREKKEEKIKSKRKSFRKVRRVQRYLLKIRGEKRLTRVLELRHKYTLEESY